MARAAVAGKKRMQFKIKADPGSEVYVAGTFNEWDAKKNKLAYRNGAYSTSLLISKGRHEYKFVINDVWCVDPECSEWVPNGIGSLNSVITVA